MTGTVGVEEAAAVAEKVVEAAAKIEPIVAGAVGMFVPGAAPIEALVQPWVVFAIPYLERALKDIADGNNGDLLNAIPELLQHISKGQRNSPILTPAE